MIAIEANFTAARSPIRLRRRNRTSSLFVDRAATFLIFPCYHRSRTFRSTRMRHKASARILIKSICFQIQALPGTHFFREDVSMARLVDTQLGIMIFLSRHSDEESVKFRHKQASPCQRSGQQFCEHAVMISVHLLHHVERTFGPGGIYPLMLPIVENAVGFTADGECSNFTSGLAVDHDNTRGITATYK